MAFNPIDRYEHLAGRELRSFFEFIEKHQGKFFSGVISYDLGYELYDLPKTKIDPILAPLLHFAAYDNFIEFHSGNQGTLFFHDPSFPDQIAEVIQRGSGKENGSSQPLEFSVKLKKQEYEKNFNKIIDYIKAGDIYQINYTHLMEGETKASGKQIFLNLLKTNPVDFAAFWEMPELELISLSPENFIQVRDKKISTSPIKGTRPRGKTPEEDRMMKQQLFHSQKEQAELFMITDLLRNDLGKIAEIGSVQMISKKKLQTLASVFHTYSKITANISKDKSGVEALISMFTGGSITGCPKKRAMEIIDEIENFSRGIYTGCIGYILPNQDMDFNIAIRTVVKKGKQLYLGVGGGITIESKMEEEFEETLAKARSFLKIIKKFNDSD